MILAGGSASRFGRPKALIDVGGRNLLQRVADALAPFAEEVIVSVGDASMIAPLKSFLPKAVFAVDNRRERGPIEGISRGVELAHGECLLVAPCDAPLLRPDLYRLLLATIGPHEAAVPKRDAFDPVRAVYRTEAVRRVLGETKGSLPSPSSLVDRLDTVFVPEADLRSVDPRLDSFVDVNREEDLAEVLARLNLA